MPEPARLVRAFVLLYCFSMHIVFLDEFGHIGPFVSRRHPNHNTSPVFGVCGYLLPDTEVRTFGPWFFNLKRTMFERDITASGKSATTWEKKGTELFTKGRVIKTKRLGYSLLGEIKKHKGKVFYSGIEKYQSPGKSNPTSLYCIVLQYAIQALDRYFSSLDENFMILIDQHNSQSELFQSAIHTMYGDIKGQNRARNLIHPPIQLPSSLHDTIQAADWIAGIIGPLWAYRVKPVEFADRQWAEQYFGARIKSAETHSSVKTRT